MEDPDGAAETGNAHARKAAEILHKWQEVSRARQNEAGAWIGKLDHYITRQSHDTMKVRGDGKPAAFQAWADFILPRLDMDRTLPGAAPAEVNQFLANVWKNLSSGIHDTSTSDALAGFRFGGSSSPPMMSRAGGAAPLNAGIARMAREGDVKRGAEAMIDRLRMQANLDAARNRKSPDNFRSPVERADIREVEDFIDFIGNHMFKDVGLRVLRGYGDDGARGAFYPAERLVEIYRKAIDDGELPRTTVHELWHALDGSLPSADRAAVTREFQGQQAKWLKANPWAEPFLSGGQLRDVLTNVKAKQWIDRFGRNIEGVEIRGTEAKPTVAIKWNRENYRFKNRDEYFAETMTDRHFTDRDMLDDKARSIFAHVRDIWQRMVAGIKRLFGGDATGRIYEGFRDRKYEPGVRDVAESAEPMFSRDDALAGFKGPGNLAKKVSQERKLHFKDADAWFDYQDKFGRGGVVESVLHGIERAARDTALMRTFGTNPEAMYQTVMKQWAKDARDRGDVALAAQIEKDTWTKKIFDTVTGDASRPGEGVLHTVGRYNRAVQQMAKLGGVVLSSLPDLVVNTAMLRHNGVNYWAGLTRQIGGMLPKGEATRGVAESIGAGMDGAWGGIMQRFQAEDGALGKMSEAVRIFHKWNGLTWWTDNLKQSAGLALSNNLAQRAGVAFDALPARMQTTLRRYGIEAAEWDGIRATAQRAADGRHYIVPEDLADRALADKLQTYYTDQIREGMTEATAGSRTAATWGTRADTIEGELVRTLMQFKTYTTTFMMRSLGRELRRDGVDVGGVASMIAGLTVMGYVSMTLKELAKGRNPRIPEDGEDWSKLVSAAFIQGGGLGLYGDFLFGDNNRMGGGFFDSLMGPTAGNISSLAKLVSDMREGSHSKTRMQLLGSDGLKIARDNTPFINLFYTQAALNYLIVYRMQEALNPGYLRRYEQRVKRENNQTFWLHPTGAPTMAAPDRPSILGGPR